MERRSKSYRKSAELIEKDKEYTLPEAIELAINTSTVKFDASVELHLRLNVDPRQAGQNIRQTVVLPAGSGKTVKIAVFADADDVAKAKKAGADIAASDEFMQQLDKSELNFDILIAAPAFMPKLGKYAKLLGPKGLMPNPKSGTVATDITKAVTEAKAGKVEYRVDSTGIIHLSIGKVSFGTDKLLLNVKAIFESIRSAKPASVKGTFVKSIYLGSTMGPSIPLLHSEL
ncbi:MAG: 50S ribosomal protein L1 [Patescibacteria group bacterium]